MCTLATGEAPAAGSCGTTRSACELADVFRRFGEGFQKAHPLPPFLGKVFNDIQACRTARLGGHMETCPKCHFECPAYNSCRNRHCPKCQSLPKAEWLEAQKAELLPVPYFHLVFTLPHELNPTVLWNKKPLLDLLFHATRQTLLEFGRRNLHGRIGFTAVLHTWDQTLKPHFHLHCLVPGGALSPQLDRWTQASESFLFPVRALSHVFRGKFLHGLADHFRHGTLKLPPAEKGRANTAARLIARLRSKPWVVYAKRPFAGPENLLDYLGRYTHRVAISNDRILHADDGLVHFTWRNRRCGNRVETMALDPHEFIRRFLLHVLPKGLQRIRHFGFLANCVKSGLLPRCRQLLGQPLEPSTPLPQDMAERILLLTGKDITRCPKCGYRPLTRTPLPPSQITRPKPLVMDSS
jgi:hypothetical protein